MNKLVKQYREDLTASIIEALSNGEKLPWQKPWKSALVRPFNPLSKTRYRGGNVVALIQAQQDMESADPRWMTMNQIKSAGLKLRKGSEGVPIEFWMDASRLQKSKKSASANADAKADGENPDAELDEIDAQKKARKGPSIMGRVYYVFNGQDIEGLPPMKTPEREWDAHAAIDRLVAMTGATISEKASLTIRGGTVDCMAFYNTVSDTIAMPPRASFDSADNYYSTLLHELAHWTGHSSRLNRFDETQPQKFGSAEYAKEELRAELASYFLKSSIGLEGSVSNHVSYIDAWLEALQKDHNEIYRAAKDASLITDFIIDCDPELKAELDATMAMNCIKSAEPTIDADAVIEDAPVMSVPPIEVAPAGINREDPRWPACEQVIREHASRFAVDQSALDQGLEMISGTYTQLVNAAQGRGLSSDEFHEMISRNLLADLRANSIREQRWMAFVEAVHRHGDESHGKPQIDELLSVMGTSYRGIIADSVASHASADEIDLKVRALIYGEKGRRPVDAEFVQELMTEFRKGLDALDQGMGGEPEPVPALVYDDLEDDLTLSLGGDDQAAELDFIEDVRING